MQGVETMMKLAAGASSEAQLRRNIMLEVERDITREREHTTNSGVVASMNQLGQEGSRTRSFTPSRRSRDACRFHEEAAGPQQIAPGTPRRSKFSAGLTGGEPVHSAAHNIVQECRYYREPSHARARSVSAERDRSMLKGFEAKESVRFRSGSSMSRDAGEVVAGSHDTIRRFDTPGGLTERMGKFRSTTPDYHRRYASNMAGVLGSARPEPEVAKVQVPPSPRGQRAAALAPADVRMAQQAPPWERQEGQSLSRCPGSTRPTKGSVRPQAFSFSSSKPIA